MARVAKTTKTTKPVARGRKPGRPVSVAAKTQVKVTKPAVAPKRAAIAVPVSARRKAGRPAAAIVAAKVAKAAAASKRAPIAAAPALKLSKDELRVQLEKLERANATLRTKSRGANRTAKAATARIAELEEIVARLEQKAASATPATPAKVEKAAAKPSRAKRQSGKGGAGATVLLGAATREHAPLDEEAETAQESLGEELGGS